MSYRYLVEDNTRGLHRIRYDGTVAADAMAAWSKAVSAGVEYVTLEALREVLVGGRITLSDGRQRIYGTCEDEAANHPAHVWGAGGEFYCSGEVT